MSQDTNLNRKHNFYINKYLLKIHILTIFSLLGSKGGSLGPRVHLILDQFKSRTNNLLSIEKFCPVYRF